MKCSGYGHEKLLAFSCKRRHFCPDKYDMIILDEINNIIAYGLADVREVINIIRGRPKKLSLVLTGRGAPGELIEIADTASEIREIKHAYSKGIKVKKGIEY